MPTVLMVQQKPPTAQLRLRTAAELQPHMAPVGLRHPMVAGAALHMVEAALTAAVPHTEVRLLTVLHTSTLMAPLLTVIQPALMVDMVTGPERITSMSHLSLSTPKLNMLSKMKVA